MKAEDIQEPGFYWTRTQDGEHRVVEIRPATRAVKW